MSRSMEVNSRQPRAVGFASTRSERRLPPTACLRGPRPAAPTHSLHKQSSSAASPNKPQPVGYANCVRRAAKPPRRNRERTSMRKDCAWGRTGVRCQVSGVRCRVSGARDLHGMERLLPRCLILSLRISPDIIRPSSEVQLRKLFVLLPSKYSNRTAMRQWVSNSISEPLATER